MNNLLSCSDLDVIYDFLQLIIGKETTKQQRLEGLNYMFKIYNPSKLDIHISLAMLIWTRIYQEDMPNRKIFIEKLREYLKDKGENVDDILIGLK